MVVDCGIVAVVTFTTGCDVLGLALTLVQVANVHLALETSGCAILVRRACVTFAVLVYIRATITSDTGLSSTAQIDDQV